MAISKLSRPYPSAARVTEQMCESSLFKSRKFPFEVADRSVCRRVPQQHCLSPSACYYVMTRAMSCDTLPLGVGVGRYYVYSRENQYWWSMHDLQGRLWFLSGGLANDKEGAFSKKAFSVFFRFTLEIPFQIRDSAIPSAIPRSRKLTGTTFSMDPEIVKKIHM